MPKVIRFVRMWNWYDVSEHASILLMRKYGLYTNNGSSECIYNYNKMFPFNTHSTVLHNSTAGGVTMYYTVKIEIPHLYMYTCVNVNYI